MRNKIEGELIMAFQSILDELLVEVGSFELMLLPDIVENATHALATLSRNLVLPEAALPQTSDALMSLGKKLRGTNYKSVIIDLFLEDIVIWAIKKTSEGVATTILTAVSRYMITSQEMTALDSIRQILIIILKYRDEEYKLLLFIALYMSLRENELCNEIITTFLTFLSTFSNTSTAGCRFL
ncbi:hypothetical protein Pcinc_037336 [Petrolisthes cinctipes]|uniref:Uncharacterized protein n=1 Tax=Petrolisthes cinctipes TaxID=88211 RepID=A0AAE1BTR9_PETCI|nr:hypothetical protein Pcinc_037336 [Petrolisthes cinctipes]